jgi:hypothetical protein
MRRSRLHSALACSCLIWFGLINTLFAAGMVVCRDGHGGSRVEWGCDRNTSDECLTSCISETGDDPGDPHPCQDTPLDVGEQLAKPLPRSMSGPAVPAPVMAPLLRWPDPSTPVSVGWIDDEIRRPPDALKHIRTILLLV